MSIPKTVVERVATFRNYIDTYKETSYKETSLCTDFIDPLFEALGWDISNKDGKPERYRDVEQQYSQRMQGSGTKKPDYLFRIGGAPAFFLETKKPSVNILDDKDSAYQLRRYGWNNDTIYVSILSNFEYLSLYDVRVQPKDKSDRPHVGLLRKYHFEDYIKKWDEIEGYLGRENVARGSLDKLLDDYQHLVKGKREPVDESLLKMIEGWREKLATNIALRNNNLDIHLLNSVVQRTIDRILFLRIAEDRGIENRKEFKLDEAMKGKNVYSKLIAIYDHADTKYNSGLFHFKKGDGRPDFDNYSKNINIDDTVLKEIIDNLYPPYYNFDFSILPVDILGHVYEKFLGRVITLDDSHQVTIKEKPEVRKAGGVYYTPKYIVDYIVNNTVGKLLEGKTPKQASKLKILDPACGSGSFLLGAFQHLIDWHVEWYTNNEPEKYAKKKNPPIYKIKGGWRLSTEKKKEILLNNIYGVDIDTQAVEVAKLNLLLKVLEEENNPDLGMKRALPDLGNNIKCGNSLIESDFYNDHPDMICDMEQSRKINAFDWDKQFPEIIKWKNSRHSKLDLESPSRELEKGYGFDAVIGNPPYRRELNYKELFESITASKIGQRYSAPRMDLWYYFFHVGFELLKDDSPLSFIVNSYWVSSSGAKKLIRIIRINSYLDEITYFGNLNIFDNVNGKHMVFRVTKNPKSIGLTRIVDLSEIEQTDLTNQIKSTDQKYVFEKSKTELFQNDKINISTKNYKIYSRIIGNCILSDIAEIKQGVVENPSIINSRTRQKYNDRFMVGEGVFQVTQDELDKIKPNKNEYKIIHPYHDLSYIRRYYLDPNPDSYIIYSSKVTVTDINDFPNIKKHLSKYKEIMLNRRETKKGSNEWWHLHWPRSEDIWRNPKIISVQMCKRPIFVCSNDPAYVPFSTNVILVNPKIRMNIKYITGVLNSKLMWIWFENSAKHRGVGIEINGSTLKKVPIKTIDIENLTDKAKHDKMVQLVETMLELNKQLAETKTSHEKDLLNRQIEMTDKMIDDLVYELYELTPEEIQIVEDSMK